VSLLRSIEAMWMQAFKVGVGTPTRSPMDDLVTKPYGMSSVRFL